MFSLQDTVRNLLADGRTTTEQAARFCSAMERAFPEAVVELAGAHLPTIS